MHHRKSVLFILGS